MLEELERIFLIEKPDLIIVQGDTNSSLCAAKAAFYNQIPVGHVEAGLRTYNLNSPFPEEYNRQVISKISHYHWCPNENNAENLRREGIENNIIISGNPIVDMIADLKKNGTLQVKENSNKVAITLHRRENKEKFATILEQINSLAENYPELEFVFPAHPNPIIQKHLDVLKHENIRVIKPMKYLDFLRLLAESRFIISDSGGIQEEAVCLGKKILICRENTERQEVIDAGIGRLVDTEILQNIKWALNPIEIENYKNPFGDGTACDIIIQSLK